MMINWQKNEEDDYDKEQDKRDEFTMIIVMILMITELMMIAMNTFAELKQFRLFLLIFFYI